MTPLDLLRQLHDFGVALTPCPDGTLRYKAARGTMTPELVARIRQYKAELHALVEAFEERAAIMEYEGGLPREESEWQAFLCICGGVGSIAATP